MNYQTERRLADRLDAVALQTGAKPSTGFVVCPMAGLFGAGLFGGWSQVYAVALQQAQRTVRHREFHRAAWMSAN
jgi:hypothetical protein